MNVLDYKVALPPKTMVFPCETPETLFTGWETQWVADNTTWPGEPKTGRLVTYDAYLPTGCTGEAAREEDGGWFKLMHAVYNPLKKGVPFTGSFRIPNSPKIARRYGKSLTPDENGVRLFNPHPEDWKTYEFTHWAAVTPDEAVWLLDKDMQRVLIKSLPYPIAQREEMVDWVRSGVSYATKQAGEPVVLKSTGETGWIETAYTDAHGGRGFVVKLDVRGYYVHAPIWAIQQDAGALVQSALVEARLERQLAAL